MTIDDLPWPEREQAQQRAASLNRLADAFGLLFRYNFRTGAAEPFVKIDCCVVPTNYRGEP